MTKRKYIFFMKDLINYKCYALFMPVRNWLALVRGRDPFLIGQPEYSFHFIYSAITRILFKLDITDLPRRVNKKVGDNRIPPRRSAIFYRQVPVKVSL